MNFNFLIFTSSIGIIGLIIKVINTPHALDRITNWNDIQKIQSLNAFGTGGIFGSGLGESIIKNGYLPQSHTDFILPIIGEELGLWGAISVITIFLMIFQRGIKIAKETSDPFGIMLTVGISFSIIIYTFINVAVVTGIFPVTGLPIPLISHGGSSLVINLACMGILLNISQAKRSVNHNSGWRPNFW